MTIADLLAREDVFVVAADEDGFITHVNACGRDVHGWLPSDLVDEPITVLIPRRYHDAHNLGFARFLATGEATLLGRPLSLKMSAKDGRELESEHVILAERVDGRWVFGATIRLLASADGPVEGGDDPT